MSKPNNIRKKALEYAKKRQWDKALNEYVRLAEIEEHNPIVFNELGDLHLKIGNRVEAFKAFHSAIDAYSRVGLFNNAVAVCKKIIRLNSADRAVYGKLARLRNEQGFKKEAVTYGVAFLEKVAHDSTLNPDDIKQEITELAREMKHSPEVLERAADYLLKWEYQEEAGDVLENLASAYSALGMDDETRQTQERMVAIGRTVEDGEKASDAPAPAATGTPEDEQGFESHRVSPDCHVPGAAAADDSAGQQRRSAVADAYDFDSVELGQTPSADSTAAATQTSTEEMERDEESASDPRPDVVAPPTDEPVDEPPVAPPPQPSPPPAVDESAAPTSYAEEPPVATPPQPPPPPASTPPPPPPDQSAGTAQETAETPSSPNPHPSSGAASDAPHDGPPPSMSSDEVWVPKEELPEDLVKGGDSSGEVVQVSDIVGQFNAEVKANVDAEDYRSHYDLGMAYLEMDLIPEAIREFQFAANSSLYEVRSLELVGLCFIKQKQPRLAIKQLEKALARVGDVDRDSIGLQYNLGLAYEMTGDLEKAKLCFEEVYMLDVTFRDVSDKIKKYSS